MHKSIDHNHRVLFHLIITLGFIEQKITLVVPNIFTITLELKEVYSLSSKSHEIIAIRGSTFVRKITANKDDKEKEVFNHDAAI